MSTSPPLEWIGQPLGPRFVLLECESTGRNGSGWTITSSSGEQYQLTAVKLPDFLHETRATFVVCRDVARVYWSFEEALRTVRPPSIGVLRRAVRDGRVASWEIWPEVIDDSRGGRCEQSTHGGQQSTVAQLIEQVENWLAATVAILNSSKPFCQTILPNAAVPLAQRYAVQVEIALGCPQQALLQLSRSCRSQLASHFEEVRRTREVAIQHRAELRRCYRPKTGAIRMHKELPDYDTRVLREWLASRWSNLQIGEEYPIAPPGTDDWVSVRIWDWLAVAGCHPEIANWIEFEQACHALKYLRATSTPELAIEYAVCPRLRAIQSWAGRLIDERHLEPLDGYQLGLLRLPDLETRCLMITAYSMTGTQVPDWFTSSSDLHQTIVERSEILQLTPPTTNVNRLVAVLMRCIGLRFSVRLCQSFVSHNLSMNLELSVVGRLRDRLLDTFPCLDDYQCLHGRLLANHLGLLIEDPSTYQRLSHALSIASGESGRDARVRVLQQEIRQITNPSLYPPINFDNREDIERKMLAALCHARTTCTGRHRTPCRFGVSTAEFLDLADDFVKALLFELGTELSLPMLVVGDAILVFTPVKVDQDRLRQEIEVRVGVLADRVLRSPIAMELNWIA